MPDNIEPPKTVREIGVHLVYMARDINALNESIKESSKNYASKTEVDAIDKRLKKIENRDGLRELLKWLGLASGVGVSVITLINILTGGK